MFFKEFVDEHNEKAVVKVNQFIEAKKVEVKIFHAFVDNLAKTHVIVGLEDVKEAPDTKKATPKKSTTKSTDATK